MTKPKTPWISTITTAYRQFSLPVFALLLCMATTGRAMDANLLWDSNGESDRAGYRIYYDTDSGPPYDGSGAGEGNSPVDVKIADVEIGNIAQYTLTGLIEDETYFFAVTAYNTSGNESGYSNEVSTNGNIVADNLNAQKGESGCFISVLNH